MKDLHQLSGAYVLDALDDDEREAFEAYMATSPATAAEVASLREVSARLATAAAETPPEGLRSAVMRRVDATRQMPPVIPPAPPGETPAQAAERRAFDRRAADRTTAGGEDADSQAADGREAGGGRAGDGDVVHLDDVRARRLARMTQAVGAVAAVAVIIALGLATTAVNLSNRLDSVEQTSAQVAMLAASPDADRFTTAYPTGGTVTALISGEHGAFAVADGLPDLDEGQIYALWGLTEAGPLPIGALHNGQALAISHPGIGALGLTIEPDGPLSTPTGTVQATLGA